MKRCLILLFVISLAPVSHAADPNRRLMGNDEFIIEQSEFSAVEEAALRGSQKDAQRLYDFYSMVALNREKALEWARVSAENGNPAGQYTLGMELMRATDQHSRLRGEYWIRRAAKSGDSAARILLKEIENKRGHAD